MEEKEKQIRSLLQSCGMKTFVKYLFPALSKDMYVTVLEMSRKYPEYNDFSANAQNSKLSKGKTIFKNGWEYDALEIIADSQADPETRLRAKELLGE
ncbi:MAG: hypothetical protein K2L17_03345 [Muribaculaceae bacterium]|nr:hypothetical protein [Muribaculaceae bacterium]